MIQMARSGRDNELITYKVQQLQREGYALDQAQAIALRMYRDGELRGTTPTVPKYTAKDKKNMNRRLRRAHRSYRR